MDPSFESLNTFSFIGVPTKKIRKCLERKKNYKFQDLFFKHFRLLGCPHMKELPDKTSIVRYLHISYYKNNGENSLKGEYYSTVSYLRNLHKEEIGQTRSCGSYQLHSKEQVCIYIK